MTAHLADKSVVLGVTGGIAAYKSAELCRRLVKAGARVQVVMTEAAGQFIAPLTLQTLSGRAVMRDLFDAGQEAKIGHIEVANTADLLVVAPATADAIARFAAGMANDLLSAIVLATKNYNDPQKVAQACRGIGAGMAGLDIRQIPEAELLQVR